MRSLVIMLSVAIGLFAGIMVLAIYKGMMRSRIKTVIYAEAGHLQIHDTSFKKDYEPIFTIRRGTSIANEIQGYPEIKTVATRSVTMGMLSTTTGSAGIQINGVIPEKEMLVSQLDQKIREGTGFTVNKHHEVLIGKKLANKLKLKTGNKLVLTCTDVSNNIISSAFRVAAIYESDNAPLDEKNVYIRQAELNEMIGTGNEIHEIVIILNKDEALGAAEKKLRDQYKGCLIENWKTISPETDLMVDTVDITSYIIMAIILFALAFGIINTMLMGILERTKEIGMMMALGMNRAKLFILILMETLFLTITGAPVGLLLGWAVTSYYKTHGINWSNKGKEMMSSFGFNTTIYPEFPDEKLAMTILFVVLTAMISCIYPAIKALKLKPVDALRK
ncbi:MAG TPA: FtsX-like permease family protein [Sediminibacterium sp.]|nr:FtsX-like permease family protein [Sediminibacterium sp.]